MGGSASSRSVVTTSPRSTIDPTPGTMSSPFLPTNPSPARAAQARSSTGASSHNGRARGGSSGGPSERMNEASRRTRCLRNPW